MNRAEMIKFISKNPNVKITHYLFTDDEYIYQKGGVVYDENDLLFEDWYSQGPFKHDGIRSREGEYWDTGWEIHQSLGFDEKYVNVKKLIDTFVVMEKRGTLQSRTVSSSDLLLQIIGTIMKVAMDE